MSQRVLLKVASPAKPAPPTTPSHSLLRSPLPLEDLGTTREEDWKVLGPTLKTQGRITMEKAQKTWQDQHSRNKQHKKQKES